MGDPMSTIGAVFTLWALGHFALWAMRAMGEVYAASPVSGPPSLPDHVVSENTPPAQPNPEPDPAKAERPEETP